MKRVFCVLLATLCLSTSAFAGAFSKNQEFRTATPEELAMTSVPGHEGAEAAILDWVRIDDDTISTTSEYYRIKIFTEEGKKHAEVEARYVPGYPLYGRVTDISARTTRPDGTVVPFDGKVFEKVVYKSRGGQVKAKTFAIPDVQPGSIIEYRFVRRWTEGYLFDAVWSVQRDIPILRSKLTLKPYDTNGQYGSFFTFLGLPPGKQPKRVRDQYELELENMPALRTEAFMPPEDQMRARVNFFYTDSQISMENYWPYHAKAFAEDMERFIGRGGKNDAQRLSQGVTDRKELLQKIYAHAQSLRNLSYEEAATEQEVKKEKIKLAKNAEDVLKKGSGFSEEINRAFVAMARQAGFEADAVRVAPRDEFFFSEKFPDDKQMSGEIAVVNLDGTPIYLDPGTPQAPFGIVSWEKTAVPGIRGTKGKPTWLQLGLPKSSDATTHRKADLRLEGDMLEGTIQITFSGQEALVRRLGTVNQDEAARKKAIEDEVKTWFPDGSTLKLTSLTGHDTGDQDLVAAFEVSLPLVSSAGSKTIVPISVFTTRASNPFAPATRVNPIYFMYPNSEEDEVKLTLPEGLTIATLPKGATLNGGALGYKSEAKRHEGTVTYTRSSKVDVTMVESKHYPALRSYFTALTTADQEPLVLVPAGPK